MPAWATHPYSGTPQQSLRLQRLLPLTKQLFLNKINDYQEEVYRYLDRKLREHPYCIQHTETDFRVILADLQLGEGCVYILKQGDKIPALAIVYPAGSTWQAGEVVAETPEMHSLLLQQTFADN